MVPGEVYEIFIKILIWERIIEDMSVTFNHNSQIVKNITRTYNMHEYNTDSQNVFVDILIQCKKGIFFSENKSTCS